MRKLKYSGLTVCAALLCGHALTADYVGAQVYPTAAGPINPNRSVTSTEQARDLAKLDVVLADTVRRERSRAPYMIVGALAGAAIGAFATYKSLEDCTCMVLHPLVALPAIGGAGLGALGGYILFADARADDRRARREQRR